MNRYFVCFTLFCFVCLTGQLSALGIDELKQKHTASTPQQIRELADAFAGGVGMEADPNIALALYQEAAGLGDAEAAFAAGYRLLIGVSGKRDKKLSKTYLNFAASKRHAAAMLWLGILAEENQEFKEAESWYRQAVELELPGAFDNLALLLLKSPATAQSLATLYAFLTQDVGLSESVKKEIEERDYLGILGADDAKFFQTRLTALGFDTKGVDGSIGPNSKKALADFRSSRGRKSASRLILTIHDLKELGFF